MTYKLVSQFKSAFVKYPPDTVFLMLLCVLSGFALLFSREPVLTKMPQLVVFLWALLLTLGSVTSLVGIFWTSLPVGFLIEGAGRSMLWPASVAYALTQFRYDQAWYDGSLILAFGLVCYIRSVYVRMVYKEWLELIESRKNESD